MPWFMTPYGPQHVIEPGTIEEFERRDYVALTAQQAADYFAGVAFPDPPSFATEAEVPGIMATVAADAGSAFSVAQRAAFGSRDRAVEALPLREMTVVDRAGTPIPGEFFGGYIWGFVTGGVISRSSNAGTSWATYCTIPGQAGVVQRLLPCSDGEVLAVFTGAVLRSTGWASGSPTWATVLTNPTPSFFYPWGIDGNGTKFIITHYSGSGTQTPDRADSRYAWISTDSGKTFVQKWDTAARFGDAVNALTHIHGATYDDWEDRFFISEGHDVATGVYVSDDDGDTWTKVPYGASFDVSPGNAPTVVKATDFGVVFGSDDPANGVLTMPRGAGEINRSFSRLGVSNTDLFGYAHMGARDPKTGVVYMVWEMNQTSAADLPALITGSDGQVAGPVWRAPDATTYLWRRIVVDDQGNVLAYEQSQDKIARGKVGGVGSRPAHLADTGRVLGGSVAGGRKSVAVGAEAVAVGSNAVAVGGGAKTTTSAGTAIGATASSIGTGQAIGYGSSADASGTAVGYTASTVNGTSVGSSAVTRHATSTAVGRDARAVTSDGSSTINATAVGRSAEASHASGDGTAVGYAAKAASARTTVVGSGATATATDATAIGQGATAAFVRSVALGKGSTVTRDDQVMVGGRDVEITDATKGVVVRSPNGTRYRLTVSDAGAVVVTAF